MEVVAGATEILTLFTTLSELCRSVMLRIENFRENRGNFRRLQDELSDVEKKTKICSETLEEYHDGITTEILKFEIMELQGIEKKLQRVEETVKEIEKKLQRRRRFFIEFPIANTIAQDISQEVQKVQTISSELNNMNETLKGIARENDIFIRPDFSKTIPKLQVPVYYEFNRRNTFEGQLKAKVLESVDENDRGNAPAYVTAAVGVSGLGGVGKTTALIGLAQDEDVKEAFSAGGIYFLPVGKDATDKKLIEGLIDMVKESGGKRCCESIDSNGPLQSAINTTSSWFASRRALFICDDLWDTSSSGTNNESTCFKDYYKELLRLLDDSGKSRMVISTRSWDIASEANAKIEFEPRNPVGQEACRMFLASARLDETTMHDSEVEELVTKVLKLCGGFPLLISIAGAQVRKRKRRTPKSSLENLLCSLNNERLCLLQRRPRTSLYPSCFNQAVETSLKMIADFSESSGDFMKMWSEYCRNEPSRPVRTIFEFVVGCFQRLCVLPKGERVSEEVIMAVWCITNEQHKKLGWSVMNSFVGFHLVLEDTQGQSRFGLHDVLLDYCEKASKVGPDPKYETYHREFLSGAWKVCYQESSSLSDTESTWDDCDRSLNAFWVSEARERCRPWWRELLTPGNISGIRNFILGNLLRLLTKSDRLAEAVGLLSHMGWTKLRITHGGISALNADFSLVQEATRSHRDKKEDMKARDEARSGIRNIWNMIKRAWPIILKYPKALPTSAYGYLLDDEENMPLVERYLASAADIVCGPWLKPKDAFLLKLDSWINGRAIRTAERVVGVAVVKSTKKIIAATLNRLFWIDIETMTVTRETDIEKEHETQSELSAFSYCETKQIIVLGFGSRDIELWNVRDGNTVHRIPCGHGRWVYSVAISADGQTVVSGSSDNTVRVWDAHSGKAVGGPLRGHESWVISVAISADGQTVVSGSSDKTVRVWDTNSGKAVGEPLRGHEGLVYSVAISADGQTVVSGSDDNTVRVWDAHSGKAVGEPLRGHEGWVYGVAISADGQTVVSGSSDKTVRVWDAHSGKAVGELLRGHEGWVDSVAISADGQTVVSGSRDKTVRVWSRDSSEEEWRCGCIYALPISWNGRLTYRDGDERSRVIGTIGCLLTGRDDGIVLFDLASPQ